MEKEQKENHVVELSVVIPCYDEEEALPLNIPPLIELLSSQKFSYELVLVNNGSRDRTPEIINDFIARGYPVRRVDVDVNQGYGLGVITGLKAARGRIVAIGCADGQVAPEDIINGYNTVYKRPRGTIVKGCRISRGDGAIRRLMSMVFNLLYRTFFGVITPDVNGVPKLMHREDLKLLDLHCRDSFFDSELLIKATFLEFSVIEIYVKFLPRKGGTSRTPLIRSTIMMVYRMIEYRFGRSFSTWQNRVRSSSVASSKSMG